MDLEKFYGKMALIRAFEEKLLELFGEGALSGTTHTCLGQEAVTAAAMEQFREGDCFFGGHRCHGYYLARFDVCLNLRRRSERFDDVIPTRVFEYLSSGKPIVSMFYPDQVEHFPDVVYGAHSPEEFARLCRRALAETGDWARLRRQEHGAGAAWTVRSEQVRHILTAIGLYR